MDAVSSARDRSCSPTTTSGRAVPERAGLAGGGAGKGKRSCWVCLFMGYYSIYSISLFILLLAVGFSFLFLFFFNLFL